MASPHFNPSNSVSFDLPRGRVEMSNGGGQVLLPANVLLSLFREMDAEVKRDLGAQVGTELGQRVARHLGADFGSATDAEVVDVLGGEFALRGLGALSLERWGRALIVAVGHSPLGKEGQDFLGAILEGALRRCFGREVCLVGWGSELDVTRYAVVNPVAARAMKRLVADGAGFGDVMSRLNSRGARG